MKKDEKKICADALKCYGETPQICMCFEEMSELL